MPYKLLFGTAAAIVGLFVINRFSDEEETVLQNSNETVKDEEDELADDIYYYNKEDNAYAPIVDNGLRRGDRFLCPDSGEELQIRAVGGRPRKG